MRRPRTRIEGGSVSCGHCNRVLTFNFIDRPAGPCTCPDARREAAEIAAAHTREAAT